MSKKRINKMIKKILVGIVIISLFYIMGVVSSDESIILKIDRPVIARGTEYQKVLTKDWGYCLIYNNGAELKVGQKIQYYMVN